MKHFRFLFIVCLIHLFSLQAISQNDSSQTIFYVSFDYGLYNVGGDWEERFSNSNAAGGSLGLKLANNWQFKLSSSFHFSNKVKTNGLLDDVINDAGDVIDFDGELVKIIYEQRGLGFKAEIGKIIPFIDKNANSGVLIQAGIGYFQHRTKIDFRDGTVFQLEEIDLKGYDRLHTGIATSQFIGIHFFGNSNFFNFFGGFEFNQAFTKNRREYNYDTRSFDKDPKLDLYYGLKLGWMIPFKKRASEEFYYY